MLYRKRLVPCFAHQLRHYPLVSPAFQSSISIQLYQPVNLAFRHISQSGALSSRTITDTNNLALPKLNPLV